MKLKNKILFITLLFLFILLININNSFAVTFEDIDTAQFESIRNNRPYFYGTDLDGNLITTIYFLSCNNHNTDWDYVNDDIFLYVNSDGVLIARNNTRNSETNHFSDYSIGSDGSMSRAHACWSSGGSDFTTSHVAQHNSNTRITYVSEDVYSDIDRTSVFFQVPVQEEVVLAQVLEQGEMNRVLEEVVALLPVVMTILVSLLALYKALRLLSDFLRRS